MKSCFVLVILCFVAMCGLITGSYWVFERVTVSEAAESAARAALQKKLGSIPEQGSLLVVDFSKPSQSKRFRMIDLATGKTGFDARVAHGLNSGGIFAAHFSNKVDSYQSSLGLFEVAERFDGKHGWSLRLDGLDGRKNNQARRRGIIIHKGDYVGITACLQNWQEGFRLGRSLGCFVLTPKDYGQLEKKLVRPAYVYAYK